MYLSSRIVFDVSSRLSRMALNTTTHLSKASISTSDFFEAHVTGIPKRPLTGYIRFSNEIRPDLMKKNPSLKVGEISKIIAQQYKDLSVARKEDFNEAYKTEKKKFDEEFEKFKNSPEGKDLLD